MKLLAEKKGLLKNSKTNHPFFSRKEQTESFFIQPKLSIGPTNDAYEREADFVEDSVMKADTGGKGIQPKISTLSIQRTCPECEEEEDVQLKESGESSIPKVAPLGVNEALRVGGKPLAENTRSFMESHIGYDFSNVRVHNGSLAAKSAQSINALAYTCGNNIVFNEGQYAPDTNTGKRLLAHELTHVVQQSSNVRSDESVRRSDKKTIFSASSKLIQRDVGTSRIQDRVTSHSQDTNTHIWSGTVTRREYVPASGSTAERTLRTMSGVRIQFDPDNCRIILPSKLRFEHPNASNWHQCSADRGHPPPTTQLSSTAFDALKARYIRLTNRWLNGWYRVRLSNCEEHCAGQEMDINVVVQEDASNADTVVVLANKTGRSCARPGQVTLHAQGLHGGGILGHRLIHESGHMALGFFDEYPVSEENPHEESVRTEDFSAAGSSSSFRDWMLLHERHYSFVPEFLRTIYPGCNAELVEISRPEANFEFTGTFGGTNYQAGGYYLGLGADLNIPLTRSRDWQLFLGAHGHLLIPLQAPDRTAFLAGARLGFQHTFGTSSGGFQWGAFGEFGYGTFGRQTPGTSRSERYGAPYYMVGGSLGYSVAPSSGFIPFINAEGGYGSDILGSEERATYGNNSWFFLGFNASFQWR